MSIIDLDKFRESRQLRPPVEKEQKKVEFHIKTSENPDEIVQFLTELNTLRFEVKINDCGNGKVSYTVLSIHDPEEIENPHNYHFLRSDDVYEFEKIVQEALNSEEKINVPLIVIQHLKDTMSYHHIAIGLSLPKQEKASND